jgi:hypothetical protein
MYVCRTMVVREDDYEEAIDPEHGWHRRRIA